MFGVALDVSDDPWNLELRHAALRASRRGQKLDAGPYESMVRELGFRAGLIELMGSVRLPSWVTPRPKPGDEALLTQASMQAFLDGGGALAVAQQVHEFVSRQVLPLRPIMIGVDHSASGGVVSALSEALGPDQLTVVVLDYHFDGLPAAVRMLPSLAEQLSEAPLPEQRLRGSHVTEYCCGSFWAHLLRSQILRPERLLMIGVGDYPGPAPGPQWECFRRSYLDFEKQGCGFFPLAAFAGNYHEPLTRFLRTSITTPYVYVSLDLDVASGHCVHAARYMDGLGISQEQLLEVARLVRDQSEAGAYEIAGLDVMEFNMHLLGEETSTGAKDTTLATAWAFIDGLLPVSRTPC
jgi:arginase family enzyme